MKTRVMKMGMTTIGTIRGSAMKRSATKGGATATATAAAGTMTTAKAPPRAVLAGLALILWLLAAPALAQTTQPQTTAARDAAALPAWDQLTPAQREQLVAPLRERWNAEPAQRARMLERAQRWQQLRPESRQNARRGMKRWQQMTPDQRAQARELYGRLQSLDPEQKRELRARWRQMTPEQRREWLREAQPAQD